MYLTDVDAVNNVFETGGQSTVFGEDGESTLFEKGGQ
jgi:hypothetical protein